MSTRARREFHGLKIKLQAARQSRASAFDERSEIVPEEAREENSSLRRLARGGVERKNKEQVSSSNPTLRKNRNREG